MKSALPRSSRAPLPNRPPPGNRSGIKATPMNLYALAVSAGLSFLVLVLVFRPLELTFPARPVQRFFRPAWFTDLCFFLSQYLLWGGLVLWVLLHFSKALGSIVPQEFRKAVAAQA